MSTLHGLSETEDAAPRHTSTMRSAAIGILVLVVLTVPKLAFRDELGETAPFLLYLGGILVAAWYGGVVGGSITTLGAAVTSMLLFIEPGGARLSPPWSALAQVGIFALEGISITLVTARLRAERFRARASEARQRAANDQLHAVLSGVSDAITVQDGKGRLIYANEPAAALLGFSSSEALVESGSTDLASRFEVVGETGDPLDASALPNRRALRSGDRCAALVGFHAADGTVRWSEVTANPVTSHDGGVAQVVNVFRDVTASQRHELALRLSHAWFSTALHSIGDGVITTDAAGRVTLVNPEAERLTGWTEDDACGTPLDDVLVLLDEATRGPIDSPVQRVLREGVVAGLSDHTLLVRRDGSELSVDDSAAPIRDADGILVGVVVVFRDVSSKRRADAAREFLALATAELDSSLDHHTMLASIVRLAVPTMADWCAVDVEEKGRLRRVAVAHVGPEKPEMVERIEHAYPSAERRERGMDSVFQRGEPHLVREIPDDLSTTRSGDAQHLEMLRELGLRSYIGVPLRRAKRIIGVISFAMAESRRRYDEMDLSYAAALADRASIAVENAMLFREAQASNRSKDEFLAMLGHELRNPLAPIRSALDLMNLKAGEMLSHERVVIDRQLVHMRRLVDDLLDVSRIARGEIELTRAPLELDFVVERAVEMASALIDERNTSLHVDVEPSLVVDGDADRLAQVVANLLNNAAKYGEQDGSIWLTARREGDHLRLSVRDDGIGVDADLLPRMFDPFSQQTQGFDRAHGGLGLGLAIVKRIVEAHGGTVAAKSDGHGQGTEIIVTLPVLASGSVRHDGPADATVTTDGAHQRVLVVDDNDDALTLLVELMSRRGYDVVGAPDAYAALELARQEPPAIGLLDLGLPGIDGYELATELRRVDGCREMVLIAVTGYGQRSDRARSTEAGFDAHLAKPVAIKQIEQTLSELQSRSA